METRADGGAPEEPEGQGTGPATNDTPAPYDTRIARWGKDGHAARVESIEAAVGAVHWVHVVARDRSAAAEFLASKFGFHELQIEDALTEGERPHLHEAEDHLFFTAPSIRIEFERIYFAEVGFFVSKDRLVTVCTEPVESLDRLFDRSCSRKSGPVRDASRLAYVVTDALVDDYYGVMDMLEDRAEAFESDVFVGKVVPIKELLRVKRRLLEIRRRLGPFRDILNNLLRHDVQIIAKADRAYFQDVYDHVLRVLEHVDLNREILASVLDANLTTVSNRLNQVMRVMTVVATILMSVTLVASVYGMNFAHMPELGWPFGYPLAIGIMVAIAAFELWLFRRMGWL